MSREVIMKNTTFFEGDIDKLLDYKKKQTKLTDWFSYQEIKMDVAKQMQQSGCDPDAPELQAEILCECVRRMPLSIPVGSLIAGSQDAAFSPSYALINPTFEVESFAGYCDPLAIYDDLKPDDEFTPARIEKVRSYLASTPYVKALSKVYEKTGDETSEVAYFVEPVTGHTIPDMRPILARGVNSIITEMASADGYNKVMADSLRAAAVLAERYADLAETLLEKRGDDPDEVRSLKAIAANCRKVPANGADNLHEAVQAYALLWQVMCLEQGPNPYAFSVGNIDRVLAPYLKDVPHEAAVNLVRHLLAFFMVGDRCWAISQNILVGGMDAAGNDQTSEMTYIVLDAFFLSNTPQPALSVKLHANTPEKLYKSIGRFFFTPGHSTPSLFNDHSMFEVLRRKGIAENDLADYAIAGCQEPLIMGKENANTTNSWMNLPKVLELTLNDGCSLISGKKIGLGWHELGFDSADAVCADLENAFWKQFDYLAEHMREAANACSVALGIKAVPFSSAMHGCFESGHDMRDTEKPGTRYFGSGCLVHGLSVLSDSFLAVKRMLSEEIGTAEDLLAALRANFAGYEQLQGFLSAQDKYGNNIPEVDDRVAELADKVCRKISDLKNYAGAGFAPDFSTPSTHLLYGYWVGATPDGRLSREMLGYGIDPRPGMARNGFQERILSNKKLPFSEFSGGYASHIGLAPADFRGSDSIDEKALAIRDRVIVPLFSLDSPEKPEAPFYVYFNVDEADHLKKVLENPAKYAPSGIYIMRIHGTFVNFLDLSSAIQYDIIKRLDVKSSSLTERGTTYEVDREGTTESCIRYS